MSTINIHNFTYEKNGKVYTATKLRDTDLSKLNLNDDCNCGDEQCIGGWVYRCMAGGGGSCVWYATNEVC